MINVNLSPVGKHANRTYIYAFTICGETKIRCKSCSFILVVNHWIILLEMIVLKFGIEKMSCKICRIASDYSSSKVIMFFFWPFPSLIFFFFHFSTYFLKTWSSSWHSLTIFYYRYFKSINFTENKKYKKETVDRHHFILRIEHLQHIAVK